MTRDQDGARATARRDPERFIDEGRHPAGGNPDDDVTGSHPSSHRVTRASSVILRAFLRTEDRLRPAGDDRLHQRGRRVKRRRTLRSLENAESSARARPDEEQAAVVTQPRCDEPDRARNGRALAADGAHDSILFASHHGQAFDDGELIQGVSFGMALFGGEATVANAARHRGSSIT